MNEERLFARISRYSTVYMMFASGLFEKEKAQELLSGCLTPDDETTRFDDSALLNENYEKAIDLIRESEIAESFLNRIKDLNTAIDKLGPLVARAIDWLPSEKYTLIAELRTALDELTEVQNREYRDPNSKELLDTSTGKVDEMSVKGSTCKWKVVDEDNNTWEGKCGAEWNLEDTPFENEMTYCPKCGKLIEEVKE